MKVLVAGDRGYIGAVLVPFLRAAGHTWMVWTSGSTRVAISVPGQRTSVPAPRLDLRDVEPRHCAGYDAVICLAALSNDPVGQLNPAATYSINLDGTLRLGRAAKKAGVERFLFASSCSLYGSAGSQAVTEEAELSPGHALRRDQGHGRAGALPAGRRYVQPDLPSQCDRVRVLAAAAPRYRREQLDRRRYDDWEVCLESDGSPWRPLVHVEDICRSFLAMLEAPRELVHDEAFNVGRAEDNVQVRDIAELVREAVPGSKVTLPPRPDRICATIASTSRS